MNVNDKKVEQLRKNLTRKIHSIDNEMIKEDYRPLLKVASYP